MRRRVRLGMVGRKKAPREICRADRCHNCRRQLDAGQGVFCSELCRANTYARIDRLVG